MALALSSLTRSRIRPNRSHRPAVAVEITPTGVIAAARTDAQAPIRYAFDPLSSGAVDASASQPNLRVGDNIAAKVRQTLETVSGDMRSVTVLLPDLATRVFSLEFDSLPRDDRDILAVLRLRLKKVVPFDVDSAKISYQVLASLRGGCKLLVVLVSGKVLGEYEGLVRDAGYEPGAVLPSALSALAALRSEEPMLSAYLSDSSLTTAITTCDDVLLYRTHELPDNPSDRDAELERDIAVAIAFFEDAFKSSPSRLHYAGSRASQSIARSAVVERLPIIDFSSPSDAGDLHVPEHSNVAGLVGALANARFI